MRSFAWGILWGMAPQPNECVQKIREIGCASVKGLWDSEVCGEIVMDYVGAEYARLASLHQKEGDDGRRHRVF